MTTFTIQTSNRKELHFPMESFRQLFPESVWTSALEMSSDTVITCENPVVSERILQLLQRMCHDNRYGSLDTTITSEEYIAAHRYLNIPIFACMTEPKFTEMWVSDPKVFRNDLEDITQYQGWLSHSMENETLAIMDYIWAKIPASETVSIDRGYVRMAAEMGWIWLLKGFFRRGFTPLTECNSKSILRIAADNKRDECFRWMLPIISPDKIPELCCYLKPNMAKMALMHSQLEEVHLLRLVQSTHQSILEPLTCDLLFHPKATRPLVEAFEFTTELAKEPSKVQQFLESKLSRAEDIPLLLERYHILAWINGVEVILKDARVTHAVIRLMHSRSAWSRDLIQIHILYCDWLANHGHIYPTLW